MPLDVFIQTHPRLPSAKRELICEFYSDGYYGFLYPFFDTLAKQTGQMIDLYDDAYFVDETLGVLAQTLADARSALAAKPDSWYDGGGFVDKQRMLLLLGTLDAAVATAKATNRCIFFLGD